MISDLGIDLGTTRVLVYGKRRIQLNEPTVLALDAASGEILCIGEEALQMVGRTPDSIRVVRPLADGVISDYVLTQRMVQHFLKKVSENLFLKPRVSLCVPSGITEVESRAAVEAAYSAGARKVFLIEEPVAAALGAGLDLARPNGVLMLDIGGGTSDIALLSMNGIVEKNSVRVAGSEFDEAIMRRLKTKFGLLVGERMAEQVKIELGTVQGYSDERVMEIKGRSIRKGLPDTLELSWREFTEPLRELADLIAAAVQATLENSPPELVGDLMETGLTMTGGGSLLHGLDWYLSSFLGIEVRHAPRPAECVAIGTGKLFSVLGKLNGGYLEISNYSE